MSRDDTSSGLAEFLRSARARLTPQQAGLHEPGAGHRRVPGLRREELARLAGVSVDYYTRLEQGRSRSASAEVLDALASALELDHAERAHLHTLAHRPRTQRKRRPKPQQVHRATFDLLDTLDRACRPAFVLGHRLDVLTHNRLAGRLITDFQTLTPGDDSDQTLFVYSTPPGSPSEAALQLLANWEQSTPDGEISHH
ncbi:helix-turn-helix domain-containing protein [Actinopolyspora halophila]|uniref:helix-turn-helix domain-containing protein n=1 Tax=Actinopolyspora halophila TaxID=1850 RepID=UPI00036DFF8E|nr:helix-turn-helix domain-containing protein [Actinopolyspora halophila]